MAELIGAALWMALEILLVLTGKVVVRSVSLGRWRGEDRGAKEGRIHGAAGALSFIRDGRRVIASNGLLFAGIAFYVLLALVLVFWLR